MELHEGLQTYTGPFISPDDDCFNATFYHSPATPPDVLRARLKRFESETRWSNLKALPFMAGVVWNKFRP